MRSPFISLEEEIDPVTGLPKTPNSDVSSILAPAAPVEPNMSMENELVGPPAPSMDAPKPEVNVRDYLMKKYGLDSKYSDEARENTIKDNEMGMGQGLMAAISAIGAGYQGKDSGAAASNMLSGFKKNADSKISQFDSARQQALQNVDNDRKMAKEDRDEKDYASKNDPMSELSIAKREAFKSAYGVDIPDTMSASKLDELSPALSKKVEMDLAKQNRAQDQSNKDREFSLKETEQGLKREAAGAKAKEGSAAQNTVRGFGKRIEQAEKAFADIANTGYDRSSIASGIGSMFPNIVRQDEAVRQDQAERNFVNAVLRRESGAAIAPSEFESAEAQYFPRAGDGEDTLKQKKANRELVLQSFKKEAGRTWDEGEQDSSNSGQPETKVVGGVKYMRVPGGWEEVE